MDDLIKTLYVFPDTNVFVQCKQLGALSWRDLGSYDKVVLLVTRPVIAEVDRQKGGSGRLAKRARLANSLFAEFLEDDEIEIDIQGSGPIVIVALGQSLEPSDELSDELNYSHADDLLVGIAHCYQQDHDHQVLFLSHDTGPLLRAKRVGLPFQKVPDDWLLTAENDEDQKRIKDLEEQLKRLQAMEPQCIISFTEAPWKLTRLKHMPLTDAQVAELMGILEAQHPIRTDFGLTEPAQRNGKSHIFGRTSVEKFIPTTEKEISEYRVRYTKWIASCEEFFREIHEKLNAQEEVQIVSTSLANVGARPADDVVVSFEITGEHFGLMAPPREEDKDKEKESLSLKPAPWSPQGKWVDEMPLRAFGFATPVTASHTGLFNTNLFNASKVRSPNNFYWKDGRPNSPVVRVEFECTQWRHQEDDEIFDLRVVYRRELEALRGAIHVTVSAANLREPVRKTQSVQVGIEEVDAFTEARKLIL